MRLKDWFEASRHASAFCFFCRRETSRGGWWSGAGPTGEDSDVVVCRDCLRPLGQLAADAFEDARGNACGDHDALRELERGFWYGLACARRRDKDAADEARREAENREAALLWGPLPAVENRNEDSPF
jgi:hypothetical protein